MNVICDFYNPVMPHNVLTGSKLDRQYPKLVVTEELELPDLVRLEHDKL